MNSSRLTGIIFFLSYYSASFKMVIVWDVSDRRMVCSWAMSIGGEIGLKSNKFKNRIDFSLIIITQSCLLFPYLENKYPL